MVRGGLLGIGVKELAPELERIGGDDTEQRNSQTFRLFLGVLASENGKKYSGRPLIFTRASYR